MTVSTMPLSFPPSSPTSRTGTSYPTHLPWFYCDLYIYIYIYIYIFSFCSFFSFSDFSLFFHESLCSNFIDLYSLWHLTRLAFKYVWHHSMHLDCLKNKTKFMSFIAQCISLSAFYLSRIHTHIHMHTHMYIYIYIYIQIPFPIFINLTLSLSAW